jgi:hypothetical protein
MKIENIYSPILDKDIKKDIKNSSIWKNCCHQEDVNNVFIGEREMYCYTIKFDGVTPIQVNNIEKL